MDEAAKAQLVARFRAYLDGDQDAAGGADDEDNAEPAPDLFTLLAELAALKAEVKGESRQVKAALDQFRELFDTLQQTNTRLGQELEHGRAAARRQQAASERDLLLELVDLRDRLQGGLTQAQRYRPGWLARRGGAPGFVAAMADGMAMNLARLDAILARRTVRPIEALGRRFDPLTMHAADVVHDAMQADGVVLDEVRRGYVRADDLLRAAEVVVNRTDRLDTKEDRTN